MAKKILPVVLMLLFSAFQGHAQSFNGCGTDVTALNASTEKTLNCSNTSSDWLNKYRQVGHWRPTASTPIKTILITFVICAKDDGSGAWPNTPYIHGRLQELINQVNNIYTNTGPSGYTSTCPPDDYMDITDSKIRFEIAEVIFINNTLFNQCPLWNTSLIANYLQTNYPQTKNTLTHIFTNPPASGPWGQYTSVNNFSYIHTEQSMYMADPAFSFHHEHLIHEYGHALGLLHTYGGEPLDINHPDFLDDVFGICPEPAELACGCNPPPNHVCNFLNCFFDLFPGAGPFPLLGGRSQNYYISAKTAGRMHKDLSLFKNNFVLGTPNMHNCVKEKYSYAVPYTVSVNETWDFSIKMYQDIVVEPGVTLTIKCEVYMPINGKIFVKPGGRLIIDGGLITSAHDQLWEGIEVWGDKTKNQYPYSGILKQGYLELKNGAIIENAREAVRLYRVNDLNTTGGIIKATNSTFRNVRRAVEFLAYQNFKIGGVVTNTADWRGNISSFQNCTFEITSNLPGNTPFYSFITMWAVDGVAIRGCTFQNTNPGATTVGQLGKGIYTIDANYNAYELCNAIVPAGTPCPPASTDKNQFINLDAAVWSSRASSTLTFSVRNSDFVNNAMGILNDGVSNTVLTQNSFTIGAVPHAIPTTYQIGMDLANNISAFKVEGNQFTEAPSPLISNETYGVWAYNTGSTTNSIYRNNFSKLKYGIYCEKLNKFPVNNSSSPGLELRCNQLEYHDWAIATMYTPPGTDPYSPYYGIKPVQGSSTVPAGNTFTGNSGDIYNYPGYYGMTYYHNSAVSGEFPLTTVGVTKLPVTGTPTAYCNSTLGSGGPIIGLGLYPGTSSLEQSIADFARFDAVCDRYQRLLKENTEGGDTAVSDKTAVMPEAILLEILAANPEVSYPTILRSLAAETETQRNRAVYDIIGHLTDGENTDQEQLRYWLGKIGNPQADYEIVNSFITSGEQERAAAFLQTIPQTHQLSGYLLEDYSNFSELTGFYLRICKAGKNWNNLDTTEVAQLRTLAEASDYTGSSRARNVLNFFYGYDYRLTPSPLQIPSAEEIDAQQQGAAALPNQIMVYPNPSGDWCIVSYDLQQQPATLVVQITDQLGKVVYSDETAGRVSGNFVLDTRSWVGGLYLFQVLGDGHVLESGKIMIVH